MSTKNDINKFLIKNSIGKKLNRKMEWLNFIFFFCNKINTEWWNIIDKERPQRRLNLRDADFNAFFSFLFFYYRVFNSFVF